MGSKEKAHPTSKASKTLKEVKLLTFAVVVAAAAVAACSDA